MANHREPTPENEASYEAWVSKLPEVVQSVARRFRPWKLYRLKTTGQRVTVYAFGEPSEAGKSVSLTVIVSARYNLLTFERQVFGIDPDDLEECELPGPDEPVGVVAMGTVMPPRRTDYNVN